MKFDLKGEKRARKRLKKISGKFPKQVGAAMWQTAQDIHRVAAPRTPVDTGHLRRSYVVDKPRIKGGEITVLIGYSAHYALWVHERTEMSFRVGGAKFLSSAVDEAAKTFAQKVAKRADRLIEKGDDSVPNADSGKDFSRGEWGEG